MTKLSLNSATKSSDQDQLTVYGVSFLQGLLRFADSVSCTQAHPIHGLHPYPAKYIPDLPREILLKHTNERHTILDPFCGSGTTLVEAALNGRKSIGIDSNPIATLISKAKTTPLKRDQMEELKEFKMRLRAFDGTLPKFTARILKNQEHWFQDNMFNELGWIYTQILEYSDPSINTFLLCIFSSIVVSASKQDSDTRYKAVEKKQPDGYAIERFIGKLSSSIDNISSYSEILKTFKNIPCVINASTDSVGETVIPDSSVDIVITSPPYPNSYDYYLYHKLRMAWLGLDYRMAQTLEIGSRYEHSSNRASIDTFTSRMHPVMQNISRVLKPSKLAYFIVGDSVLAGKYIDMSELYKTLSAKVNLHFVDEIEYDLSGISRSFQGTRDVAGNSHKLEKKQRIIVFERRNTHSPLVSLRTSALPLSIRIPSVLDGSVANGSIFSIASNNQDRHIHALAGFPSKFIPEIPRWAISQFSTENATVLDPFSGSGTTAVEALLSRRNAISVDINPFAALMCRVKTARVDEATILKSSARLLDALKNRKLLPTKERLHFELDDFWFNVEHLTEFASIDEFIKKRLPKDVRDFFRVALASTIRFFSYQDQSQIKVKRDPKKVLQGTTPPSMLFEKKLSTAIPRYVDFLRRLPQSVSNTTLVASADKFVVKIPQRMPVDLIVTSPPYINAMNYSMATRYELILLGLVKPTDMIAHQEKYFGSERVYAKQYKELNPVPVEWSCSSYLNQLLEEIYHKEPKRSFIAGEYFKKMRSSFENMKPYLKQNGILVIVAGTNTIRQVKIDTFNILVTLLEDIGFSTESRFHYEIIKQVFKITRHETANIIPQDGVAVMRKV